MITNRWALIAAVNIIVLAIVVGLVHYTIDGVNEQFGIGFGVGALIVAGINLIEDSIRPRP